MNNHQTVKKNHLFFKTPAFELENVSKAFSKAGVVAADNISLTVSQGEVIAIVGPSGSGKSTLLHLISGIESPDSGSVKLFGCTPQNKGDWQQIRAQKIGFVFQSFHLLRAFTVRENIEIPLLGQVGENSLRQQRVQQLLERVQLTHRADHRPSELSGGEQQRAAIARSLANNPSLLLADEPTGNLDSRTGESIIALFHSLQKEDNTTLLLVTHQQVVANGCMRVVELKDGSIVSDSGS